MVTSTKSAIPAGTRMQNVSNMAAFGIHFTNPGSDTLCGLTCLRGTEHLTLDMKVDGRWSSITVVNPERFTAGHDIESPKQWAQVVERWFAASTTDSSIGQVA